MNTPRYTVRRVGNDYQILRSDPQGAISSSMLVLAGMGIALLGLFRRRSLFSIGAVLAGAGAIYYGVSGHNPIEQVKDWLKISPLLDSRGPSYRSARGPVSDQRPQDEVDEASMESFPASDPPSHTSVAGLR